MSDLASRFHFASAPVSWGVEDHYGPAWAQPYEQILDEMVAGGFTGTELGPYGYFPKEAALLGPVLKHKRLAMLSSFVPVSLADPDSRSTVVDHIKKVGALLAALKAPYLVLADADSPQRQKLAGHVAADGSQSLTSSQWREVSRLLVEAEKVAAGYGLDLVFHPHVGTYVETPRETEQLFEAAAGTKMGLCLDTGHCYYGGGDPVAEAEKYKHLLRYIHIKDINRGVLERARTKSLTFGEAVEAGVFSQVGEGCIDFPAFFQVLVRNGYSGWFVVEQDVKFGATPGASGCEHGREPEIPSRGRARIGMKDLPVAVIGVGEMGSRHAENLRRLIPGAKLVAVADVNAGRSRAIAAALEVEAHDSVDAVLSRPDIAAVIISSPPAFHLAAIQAAAAAGKHIFCEKPLTLTVEDADTALAAVRKAGVLLQVGHMRRYDPAYAEAKKRIDAGEIGRIVIFKGIGRDFESPPSTPAQTGINGTLFHDSSSHDFDMARWLTGDEVVEVFAYGGALVMPEMQRFGAMDSGVVNLRFRNGAIGNVESFLHARYGYDVRTEVVGTEGTLQIGELRQTPLVLLRSARQNQDLLTHWLNRFAEAYRLEMADFIRSVRAGKPPAVGGEEGRQSVAIAVAAVQSHREHRPVQVSLPQ